MSRMTSKDVMYPLGYWSSTGSTGFSCFPPLAYMWTPLTYWAFLFLDKINKIISYIKVMNKIKMTDTQNNLIQKETVSVIN